MIPSLNQRSGARGLALAMMLSAVCGCDEEFGSRVALDGYRVIGIEAEPPEVATGGRVRLTAHDYNAEALSAEYHFRACAFDPGPRKDFACPDPALEFDLGRARQVDLDLGPDGIGLDALIEAHRPPLAADGSALSSEDGFDLLVTLVSGPACDDCREIKTVKRVHVQSEVDQANANPVISELMVDGALEADGRLTLSVDADDPQTYRDRLTQEMREEVYLYTWYSDLGETDPGLSFGETRQTEWRAPVPLPDGVDTVTFIVAVRDGRGGFATSTAEVTIDDLR